MIYGAETQSGERAHDIRRDGKHIELTARHEALHDFAAQAQKTRDDEEGEVEDAAPRGVEDPVEGEREEEEGDEVKDLVVHLRYLHRPQSEVGG